MSALLPFPRRDRLARTAALIPAQQTDQAPCGEGPSEAGREDAARVHGRLGRVLTLQQLARCLGLRVKDVQEVGQAIFVCDERHLAAGEAVFEPSSGGAYLYLVQRGLIEVTHAPQGQHAPPGAPSRVMFAGPQTLLGLAHRGRPAGQRAEALTDALVLAIPAAPLERLTSASGFIRETLWQHASLPLFRAWQWAYKLQGLAPADRLCKGLIYLDGLARSTRLDASVLPLRLSFAVLQMWLGMPGDDLHGALEALASGIGGQSVSGGLQDVDHGGSVCLERLCICPDRHSICVLMK